jgi:ribosomal protein L37AE/L43A
MIRIRRKPRLCPRCRAKLELLERRSGVLVCRRCLLVWHGDTFEPITQEALGSATIYDLFA